MYSSLVGMYSESHLPTNLIMLDTQSAVHLISNEALMTDITTTLSPIVVQGITKDKLPVTLEGYVPGNGVTSYFGPNMAANMLSYHKLQQTHRVRYDDTEDTFIAVPFLAGPVLTFACVKGHYILDLTTVLNVFATTVQHNSAKYS